MEGANWTNKLEDADKVITARMQEMEEGLAAAAVSGIEKPRIGREEETQCIQMEEPLARASIVRGERQLEKKQKKVYVKSKN